MQRSRTQIATSYAPGALFTYEGGLGCCVSVALSTPVTPSSPAVEKQIFEHLSEFVESWFSGLQRAGPSRKCCPSSVSTARFSTIKTSRSWTQVFSHSTSQAALV